MTAKNKRDALKAYKLNIDTKNKVHSFSITYKGKTFTSEIHEHNVFERCAKGHLKILINEYERKLEYEKAQKEESKKENE